MKTMLYNYFKWLRDIFVYRIEKDYSQGFRQVLDIVPPPGANSGDLITFEQVCFNHKLNGAEQLVLLLSLAPYYIPDFLCHISQIAKNEHNKELFFNSGLVNKALYPTIETALILLGGNNITEREENLINFSNDAKLFKNDIISLPTPPYGEPFTMSTLIPDQTVIGSILSGRICGPEFSHDFPANVIESDYSWHDLILDESTRTQLQELKEWLQFVDICEKQGIHANNFKRDYKCLFYGPPGTGKTMAASLIGKLTGHKVFRIDLSAVVSKYIGETEKNLARIFDRASHGQWILFFDEADALFGKRGETHNANERYANQEVSYLLQRFETYEGVSILASNYRNNIDMAFYRRFHSIISFKKPEADERLQLWKVHLPKGFKYDENVNLNEISQSVKITGAGIHNVLRRSCMKAVINGDMVIKGQDLYESVKLEFAKENKTI